MVTKYFLRVLEFLQLLYHEVMCGHNNNADIALQLQLSSYVERTLPGLTTPLLLLLHFFLLMCF